jgi:hypothetical protein
MSVKERVFLKFHLRTRNKHIFTSPSSVEREPKATRSSNARIHGMTQVTPASIAYLATQVCSMTVIFHTHT